MKKFITYTSMYLVCIVLFFRTTQAQISQPDFICGTTDSLMRINFMPDSASLSLGMYDSRLGGVFTARDTLRVLVVYCGFTNDNTQDHALYNDSTSIWPWDSVAPRDAKKLFYKNFNQFDINSNDFNISNFYYQMSRHADKPFKLIAETFPYRIDVTATDTINSQDNSAFTTYTQMAYDSLQKYYPNFNWSKFDTRKNRPNFEFDNSDNITYPPDKNVDYLIVVWRYDKEIGIYNTSEIQSVAGWAHIPPYNFINSSNDTLSVKSDAGFTVFTGVTDSVSLTNIFVHEVAHTLYNAPHTFAANDIVGKHFVNTEGWGMIHGYMPVITQCANSWERWYNGWTEITYDLSNSFDNGNYVLRDFITTGDAIRIKLPHVTNQYIWLENHQNKHKFDSRLGWNVNYLNDSIPSREKGVFAFIENIASQRSDVESKVYDSTGQETYVSIFEQGANGLRALSSEGNGEYIIDSSFISPQWWNNTVYDFNRVADNAVGIHGNNSSLRFDYNNNNLIQLSSEPNSASNEHSYVVYLDNGYKYSRLGAGITFLEDDEISLSSKTVPTNYPTYNTVFRIPPPPDYLKLSPTYLNGISIKIINYDSLGNANIEINFDNYDVNNDTRWCGDIILSKNTTDSTLASLNLVSNKSILIDRPITPNRTSKLNGEFINPTLFTCKQSSFVKLNEGADLIVDNGSTFKMESTSKLEINSGAVFNVKNNSILNLTGDAQIIVKEGGKLLIEKGSSVQLNGNAKIILEDPTSFAQLNSILELKGTSTLVLNGTSKVIAENKGKIHVRDTAQFNITANAEFQYDNGASLVLEQSLSRLGFDGKIRIANNTQFTFTGSGYMKVSQSTGQFIPGTNSSVRISGSSNSDQIVDIAESVTLTFPKGLAQLTLFNGKITMDDLSRINVYCKARVASTKFTSWDGNPTTHKGLNLFGQGGVYISSCTFEKGAYGVYNTYKPNVTRRGGKLYISSSVFQDLETAYYQYGGGFSIFNSEFTDNHKGITTNITEINSEINNCEFDGNSNYAIRYIGTGTASLTLESTNINGSSEGIFSFGNNQTNIKCGLFSNNTNSVFGYFDPSFNLSSEMNGNGTVTFNNEGQIFSFYHAGDLFLAQGFNNFFPATIGSNEIINGTQNRYVPSGLGYFNAFNNDWNSSGLTPIFSSDYEVTSTAINSLGDSIYYVDNNPITSSIECGTAEPCTACPEEDLYLLKSCDCETINTTHIDYLPLNTALQNIIDDLSTATDIESREESVIELKELLTYAMTSVNDDERFLLKYAYRMFKDELALCISDTNFVDSAALSTYTLLNDYLGYFSDIIAYQKDLPSADQLFDDVSILKLDAALSYKLLDDQTEALDQTDDLFAIVEDIKDPYITYWTCILTNEVDYKSGSITQDQFETYTNGCWAEFAANYEGMNRVVNNNTNHNVLKSSTHKNVESETSDVTNKNNSHIKQGIEEIKQLNIYPNPTTNSFTLIIPEQSNHSIIKIYNMYGQEILEEIHTNKNNFIIDLSNHPDGYYICTVVTENSKYEAKIIKIK